MTLASYGQFARHVCIAADVHGYGRADDQDQYEIQTTLSAVLSDAASRAGLDRSIWITEGRGDEELALVPPGASEPRLVDDFVRELDHALYRHNRNRIANARMQLRMAIHHGVAYPAAYGFAGQGVVTVARILNSAPLRAALARPGVRLAVAISDSMYHDIVVQGHTSLPPSAFEQISVKEKEFSGTAWVRTLGAPEPTVTKLPEAVPEAPQPRTSEAPVTKPADASVPPGVVSHFHATVDARNSNFGVQRTSD